MSKVNLTLIYLIFSLPGSPPSCAEKWNQLIKSDWADEDRQWTLDTPLYAAIYISATVNNDYIALKQKEIYVWQD